LLQHVDTHAVVPCCHILYQNGDFKCKLHLLWQCNLKLTFDSLISTDFLLSTCALSLIK
jgi:hypothetical protein